MRAEATGFVVALACASACGRLGFDPTGEQADALPCAAIDATSSNGDGGVGPPMIDASAPLPDAQPPACAEAIPVTFGVPITIDTCSGNDRVDACGPDDTEEVVFELVAPATGSYTIRARDTGTQNVSSSTGIVDEPCTGTTSCAAVLGRSFTVGQVVYFAVEASSGGCVTIDFEVI